MVYLHIYYPFPALCQSYPFFIVNYTYNVCNSHYRSFVCVITGSFYSYIKKKIIKHMALGFYIIIVLHLTAYSKYLYSNSIFNLRVGQTNFGFIITNGQRWFCCLHLENHLNTNKPVQIEHF